MPRTAIMLAMMGAISFAPTQVIAVTYECSKADVLLEDTLHRNARSGAGYGLSKDKFRNLSAAEKWFLAAGFFEAQVPRIKAVIDNPRNFRRRDRKKEVLLFQVLDSAEECYREAAGEQPVSFDLPGKLERADLRARVGEL